MMYLASMINFENAFKADCTVINSYLCLIFLILFYSDQYNIGYNTETNRQFS